MIEKATMTPTGPLEVERTYSEEEVAAMLAEHTEKLIEMFRAAITEAVKRMEAANHGL